MTLEELKQFSRRSEALSMKDFRETLQRFGMDDEYIMEKCSEFLRNPIFFICSRTDEDLARALLSLVMYGVEEAGHDIERLFGSVGGRHTERTRTGTTH